MDSTLRVGAFDTTPRFSPTGTATDLRQPIYRRTQNTQATKLRAGPERPRRSPTAGRIATHQNWNTGNPTTYRPTGGVVQLLHGGAAGAAIVAGATIVAGITLETPFCPS